MSGEISRYLGLLIVSWANGEMYGHLLSSKPCHARIKKSCYMDNHFLIARKKKRKIYFLIETLHLFSFPCSIWTCVCMCVLSCLNLFKSSFIFKYYIGKGETKAELCCSKWTVYSVNVSSIKFFDLLPVITLLKKFSN